MQETIKYKLVILISNTCTRPTALYKYYYYLQPKIYVIPSRNRAIFSKSDFEMLFGQVEEMMAVSRDFLTDLENGVSQDLIGWVFEKHLHAFKSTYGNYCKTNDAAMAS